MSKAKITRIRPSEQAPRSAPLADVAIAWTPDGTTAPQTIDGAALARLLSAAGARQPDGNEEYLGAHLTALHNLTTALGESGFLINGAETAPSIFWALSQYLRWLRLEVQWGYDDTLQKVLASATVTIGATAEEAPS